MRLRSLFIIYYRQTRKHRVKSLSLITLFAVAMVMVHMAVYELVMSRYEIRIVKELFPERENLYNISVWVTDAGEAASEGMKEFLGSLGRLEGVESAGKFYFVDDWEFEELREDAAFLQFNERMVKGTFRESYPSTLSICYIDRELAVRFGAEELLRSRHGDFIPVMVGAGYQEYFKKGQVYTDRYGNRYQICGVLPEGFRMPARLLFHSELPYENMDDKLLALNGPQVHMDDPFVLNACNSIYCVTDGTGQTLEEVERLANQCFIRIEKKTVDEKIAEYKEEEKSTLQITALFSGIAVFAAFLSMVSSSVIQIVLKKQEYGIFFANGMSGRDGVKLIALENGIRQLLSFAVATAVAANRVLGRSVTYVPEYLEIFGRLVVWKGLVIVFALFLASTAIPALVLTRMKPAQLLGGNEI